MFLLHILKQQNVPLLQTTILGHPQADEIDGENLVKAAFTRCFFGATYFDSNCHVFLNI